MTSALKRKQLVNELRQAHFPMGFDSSQGTLSEYRHKYPGYEGVGSVQSGANRTNNFSIGDGPTQPYLSEFKQRYPGWQGAHPQHKAQTKDSNNIVFGYENDPKLTSYKEEFAAKQRDEVKGKIPNPRQSHINFGDSLSNFTTTYKQTHDEKQPAHFVSKHQDTRQSNLMFGHHTTNFITSNNATYAHKHGRPATLPPKLPNNVHLGDCTVPYTSQHQQQFKTNPMQPYKVDKQTIRDFRNAHFSLAFGQQPPNQSEAQSTYTKKPITMMAVQLNKGTNIDMQPDSNNYYESSYNRQFQERKGERAEVENNARDTNVVLGWDDPRYTTENKGQFGLKTNINKRVQPILPSGGLVLGEEKQDYTTHYRATHDGKQMQKQPMQSKDNKANFVHGFAQQQYSLTSTSYGKKQGASNQLSKETIAAMRGTNIPAGQFNPFSGDTTYHAEYVWKKGQQ